MSVAIRLMRFGKKHYPTYRIVVTQKHSKRNGAYIESLGIYNPNLNPFLLKINRERLTYWLSVGAQLSEGISKLKSHLIEEPQLKKDATTKAAGEESAKKPGKLASKAKVKTQPHKTKKKSA